MNWLRSSLRSTRTSRSPNQWRIPARPSELGGRGFLLFFESSSMSRQADRRRAGRALDAVNFFLADVRDGLGPYLAVYLLTEQRWDEARIGVVMSVATAAGILAQTPAGALIDATRVKRLVMIIAAVLVTIASLSLPVFPGFLAVTVSQGVAH